MLLAIDIGNSSTSVGLFDQGGTLQFLAVLATDSGKTSDQFSVDLMNLFTLYGYDLKEVDGAILCSVVPPVNFMVCKAVTRLLGKPAMTVGPGMKTGLNIHMDFQTQMGADIVAEAVAALDKFSPPIVTIGMGTAITVGVISRDRTYEGGLLLPGVNVSLEALSRRAAQLPAISLQHPKSVIGKNTEDCMRAGIVYGTAGMLDGILDRIQAEFPRKTLNVVATGGNAPVIVRYCRHKIVYDKYLLMNGLWEIYQRNV
jgi:type III pantothenate kinase